MALWQGDLAATEPLACRVHSSCFTSEALGALDRDCAAQLDVSLRAIALDKTESPAEDARRNGR